MLEETSPLERARAQAYLLLKFRPRSESELRKRLTSKRIDPAVLDSLLEELKKKDLVNDAKFAQYFANQRMVEKPMSRRALVMDLKAKGVSSDLAAQAAGAAAGEQGEFETARELALRRVSQMKGVDKQALQRRLAGFLGRRGFSSEVVFKVVREVTAESSHPRESEDQGGFPLSRE